MEIISKKEVDFHYTSSRLKSNYFPGGEGKSSHSPRISNREAFKFMDRSSL